MKKATIYSIWLIGLILVVTLVSFMLVKDVEAICLEGSDECSSEELPTFQIDEVSGLTLSGQNLLDENKMSNEDHWDLSD